HAGRPSRPRGGGAGPGGGGAVVRGCPGPHQLLAHRSPRPGHLLVRGGRAGRARPADAIEPGAVNYRPPTLLVWFAFAGGAVAWALQFVAGLAFSFAQCDPPPGR